MNQTPSLVRGSVEKDNTYDHYTPDAISKVTLDQLSS